MSLLLFFFIALYYKHDFGGSSNGRTAAFEAVNLGSNPSPRAMHRTVHGAALNRMVQGEPPGLRRA